MARFGTICSLFAVFSVLGCGGPPATAAAPAASPPQPEPSGGRAASRSQKTCELNGKKYVIKITCPNDGAQVPQAVTVRGCAEGDIPQERFLWFTVSVSGNAQIWPQPGGPLSIAAGRNWKEQMNVGASAEPPDKQFKISLLSLTAEANDFFAAYVRREEVEQKWPGVGRTEFRSDLVDAISVTRGAADAQLSCEE